MPARERELTKPRVIGQMLPGWCTDRTELKMLNEKSG